uniref:HTH_48 domain-containing protein n=1 Tax=Macrostomum lignano TaxID=282301 RepID=A0A1I8JKM9_9PLAT
TIDSKTEANLKQKQKKNSTRNISGTGPHLLLYDNAQPHTAKKTLDHINNLNFDLLPHPPYSPNLALSDYAIFPLLKFASSSEHFYQLPLNFLAMAESFSKQDVRSLMKFQFLQGKKPPDMFRELQQVLGNCAPTEQTVRKWYRLFAEGRESVEDNGRSGRPMTATKETVVKKVQELLDDDRRRTCEELAEDVGVSVGSVHTILTERLLLQKKFCKWVPHLLTGEQKMQRTVASSSHLRRFHREGEDFLSRIVAGDETWVYSWDPETKAQSAEWLPAHSPRPQKAIRKQGAIKIMHVMFFDSQGILLNWAVPQGTTVNGDYY